jgi:hypothetical protein
MRTPRDFRPDLSARQLEKRVVPSTAAAMVAAHGHHALEPARHEPPATHGAHGHKAMLHSALVPLTGSLGSGASLGFNPLNSSFVSAPTTLGSNTPRFTSPLGLEGGTVVSSSTGFLSGFVVSNGVDIIGTPGADDGFLAGSEPFATSNAGFGTSGAASITFSSVTVNQTLITTSNNSTFVTSSQTTIAKFTNSSSFTNNQTNVAGSLNSSFVTNNQTFVTSNHNDIVG